VRRLYNACLFVILSAALVGTPVLASPASPASAPLGVVLQADNAQVGADITAGGATIYDGDRLRTESGGTLRAQLGGPQMFLRQSTTALVRGLPNGFSAELGTGTVVVSSAPGQMFQLLADGATIQPADSQGVVAQITRVNDRELLLTGTRGVLRVTMGDEVKMVEAGNSYRLEVEADTSDPGPQPQNQNGPYHTARNRFLWIILPAIGVGTGIVIWRALASPSGF
jgi:hypothetical protein